MKIMNLLVALALFPTMLFGQAAPTTKVTNQVHPLNELSGEMVSQVKLAKEYFMTSSDPAAGKDFEERTANLSKRIVQIFQNFRNNRKGEYEKVGFVFSSSDWATGKHTPKTVAIPADTYIFYQIERTTNGDWKGGPTINGIDRKDWKTGDIPGGNVWWVTGGHGSAQTFWNINARYDQAYISSTIDSEIVAIKGQLHALNLPTQ